MTGLPLVTATRYVLPLREGGSLPGLVECDDLGTYVVKWRGAGQGRRALVAELIVGELGRRLGLPVPDLAMVRLDTTMANAEPDQEVQDLLFASAGDNLGMDYLPGSIGLDAPVAMAPELAADILWFDALVANVDRSWRNPNLLRWHGDPWLIDHGAALYWHHNWPTWETAAAQPYPTAADHVLLSAAGPLAAAHERLAPLVTDEMMSDVVALVPDGWLDDSPEGARQTYAHVLTTRAAAPEPWLRPLEVTRAAGR